MQLISFIAALAFLNRLRGWDVPKSIIEKKPRIALALRLISNKCTTSALSGVAAYWYLSSLHAANGLDFIALYQAMIVLFGILIWAIDGWGRGFTAFQDFTDGRYFYLNSAPEGVEDIISDWIMSKRVGGDFRMWVAASSPSPKAERILRCWGTVKMALRGQYLLPLFLALGWLNGSLLAGAGIGALVGLSQGAIYRAMQWVPVAHFRIAELIMGASIAFGLSRIFQ